MRTKRTVTGLVLTALTAGAFASAATVANLSTHAATTHTSSIVKALDPATTPGATLDGVYHDS